MKTFYAIFMSLCIVGCSDLKPTDQKEVCVDAVAILHNPSDGSLKRVEYGGCTEDEQHSYYKEAITPLLASGYEDLAKVKTKDSEDLLVRIKRYHEKTGNYPATVKEIAALETHAPKRKVTSKIHKKKAKH